MGLQALAPSALAADLLGGQGTFLLLSVELAPLSNTDSIILPLRFRVIRV